jgi:hypothetical protein
MPSHLCLSHYGPRLIVYETGACIVRQTQEWTGPEYIRLRGPRGRANHPLAFPPAGENLPRCFELTV